MKLPTHPRFDISCCYNKMSWCLKEFCNVITLLQLIVWPGSVQSSLYVFFPLIQTAIYEMPNIILQIRKRRFREITCSGSKLRIDEVRDSNSDGCVTSKLAKEITNEQRQNWMVKMQPRDTETWSPSLLGHILLLNALSFVFVAINLESRPAPLFPKINRYPS